jgi:hypothetical protein
LRTANALQLFASFVCASLAGFAVTINVFNGAQHDARLAFILHALIGVNVPSSTE